MLINKLKPTELRRKKKNKEDILHENKMLLSEVLVLAKKSK